MPFLTHYLSTGTGIFEMIFFRTFSTLVWDSLASGERMILWEITGKIRLRISSGSLVPIM
jgi:hypothetical protein